MQCRIAFAAAAIVVECKRVGGEYKLVHMVYRTQDGEGKCVDRDFDSREQH